MCWASDLTGRYMIHLHQFTNWKTSDSEWCLQQKYGSACIRDSLAMFLWSIFGQIVVYFWEGSCCGMWPLLCCFTRVWRPSPNIERFVTFFKPFLNGIVDVMGQVLRPGRARKGPHIWVEVLSWGGWFGLHKCGQNNIHFIVTRFVFHFTCQRFKCKGYKYVKPTKIQLDFGSTIIGSNVLCCSCLHFTFSL